MIWYEIHIPEPPPPDTPTEHQLTVKIDALASTLLAAMANLPPHPHPSDLTLLKHSW